MAGRRIDGHRHVVSLQALKMANTINAGKANTIYSSSIDPRTEDINRQRRVEWAHKLSDLEENLSDLKAGGMDMGILQPAPNMFFYWADSHMAGELSRICNEHVAQCVRKYPDHFRGLATIPLPHVEEAVKEVDYAVLELGLSGVAIASNVNGRGFDEQQFRPFLERVEELDVPLVVHPHNPAGAERIGRYYLINFLGMPLESTVFAAQLVFAGVLDRYPRLKICLSHAGGVLPFLLGRLEHGGSVRPEAQETCEHPFSYYMKNFYVDTITYRPDSLRLVLETMGETHVFMGTDYPYDMADTDPIGSVRAAITDENLRDKIYGGNLRRLFGIG